METSRRSKRRRRFVRAVTAASLLVLLPLGAEQVLPLSQVAPGMKGYGLSVVEGTKVERFEVEVLGILPNLTPGRSVIIVRTSGLSLEKNGIAQGMSGSPVYLEGKLAGALSSGWAFAKEPIAGVTPIEAMMALDPASAAEKTRRTAVADAGGVGLPRAAAALAALGTDPSERLEALSREVESSLRLLSPPASPGLLALSVGGFPAETLVRNDMLLSRLGLPAIKAGMAPSLAAAPAVGPSAPSPSKPAPGSAVTALLVDGDLQLGATGTVTSVDADGHFVAFGHPFLGFGELEIPVAPARVITVLSNLYVSFKLGYPGAPAAWRLTKDRDVGVAGRSDRSAPMIPVLCRFRADGETKEMKWSVVPQPRLFPVLLALSTDAALTTLDPTPRERTVRFRIALSTAAGPLVWEDLISGGRAKELAVSTAAVLAGAVADNEFEDPLVSAVAIDVSSEAGERRIRIIDAALGSRKIAPGDELSVTVRLADRRGPTTSRSLKLAIPRETPEGHAIVLVGDGNMISAARMAAQPAEPHSLGDFRKMLARIVPNDRLGAALIVPSRGAPTGAETMSSLPPTAAALLAEGERGETGRTGVGMRILSESLVNAGAPVSGSVRLEIDVEKPRP
jgi:hypothetical protein